jgi:hypothetical protein
MVAEAHGWNAVSDKPAMLAVAEQCERDGQPYYVGYENTKPARFTTALATETDLFEFGVWGPDQPVELLPADAAREVAETNALIDEISERHGLSTRVSAQPVPQLMLQCCGVWIDYPQAGGETMCPVCHTTFLVTAACPDELVSCEECSAPCDGTLTAYSELMGEDVPVCPNCRAMCALLDAVAVPVPSEAEVLAVAVTLTLSDNAAGCPVHGADPCFCAELTSDAADPGRHAGHVWDIPSDYTGRHRNTDAAIDDAWLQRL